MSNPIPPFVCSTPPPIEFIADTPPPLVEDDFGDFAAVDDQFVVSSLPATPVHVAKVYTDNEEDYKTTTNCPLPDSSTVEIPHDKNETSTLDVDFVEEESSLNAPLPPAKTSNIDLKTNLPFIIEAHSPPPLDYEQEGDDLTPCDDLENEDETEEFPADDVAKYDDNVSLPSLKFDSLSNLSKSITPVSDELTKSNHEDLNSFQPISIEAVNDEVKIEKVSLTELNEAKPVSIETWNVQECKETNNNETLLASPQSNTKHDDDFTEFEGFSAASQTNVINSFHDKPPDENFEPVDVNEPVNESAVFEADFSQFSSFPEVAAPPPVNQQSQLTVKSALDDLEADDFDDFQDFSAPPAVADQRKASLEECATISTASEIESSNKSIEATENNEPDDDEFGEFSEVIESNPTNIPSSNSGFDLSNLNEKLKPILEMMFPITDALEKPEKYSSNDLQLQTTINQIDSAKALDYQWNNSEVRHSLIKSLGVDSRNILYGEKWNSSMPRYAANLSFNPLEPMKSDKSAAGSSRSSTTDYKKRSEGQNCNLTMSKTDVPAVEFDWNSSGLVNPLDGVKEILHERTIETLHSTKPGESYASIDKQSSSAFDTEQNIFDSNKSLRDIVDEEAITATIEFKSNADASITISTATSATITAAATTSTINTTAAALPSDYIDITSSNFHSSVLETNIDTVIASSTQVHNQNTRVAKYQESTKTDLETELQQHAGVVATSTYAGPLKETHIFTPSKSENILSRSNSKTPRTSENKCPIDFDYEIAAAGIIIDETVVKKEYRDVEYNPGFSSKYREEIENNRRLSPEIEQDSFGANGLPVRSFLIDEPVNIPQIPDKPQEIDLIPEVLKSKTENSIDSIPTNSSFDDEFSDFQSVPAPASTIVPSTIISSSVVAEPKTSPSHCRVLKEAEQISSGSRTGTPVSLSDEMILCPAILLPQAIQMENKPKIEWPEPGINPEELARIEELFPQPKASSNKPSPSHSIRSQKHQNEKRIPTTNVGVDDDDWSDFVSVPAATNSIQSISEQFQRRQASPLKSVSEPNDEEWSDFVSSAPPPVTNNMRPPVHPQFNSASWQNANFYNNPMSAYASPPTSFYYQPPSSAQQNFSNNIVPNLKIVNNNTSSNNNMVNNNSINHYLISNQANQLHHHNQHHKQHIQMMRDFSSSSPMDAGSLSSHVPSTTSLHHQYAIQAAAAGSGYGYVNSRGGVGNIHGKSNQFGSGSNKVSPSISLIPDLGFVAPPHSSFISVPKNSFITKK